MMQKEFEKQLLAFLKKEGGFILFEQIAHWKLSHSEFSGCSVQEALESLRSQGLVELNERGAKAL